MSDERIEAEATYTVHLRVEIEGPDVDWDGVAYMIQQRVQALRLKGGFAVAAAEVDEAGS